MGLGDASGCAEYDTLAFRVYDQQLAGKILHIDRNGSGLAGPSVLPVGHPSRARLRGSTGSGFRNPFRFKWRDDGTPTAS